MLIPCLAMMANAYPGSYNDANLKACAGGNCPNAHGNAPQAGNALTAGGKTDGGTYTPGETINLANAGGGQYALYAEAGGAKLARSDDAATTVTAPASGTLTLVGIRAAGRNQCTYQVIKLTAGAGGGGGGGGTGGGAASAPPPSVGGIGGSYAPPPAPTAIGGGGSAQTTPDNQFESKDKMFRVTWQPMGATMQVVVATKPMVGSYNPPTYVGFTISSNGKLLGSGDSPRLVVVGYRPSTLPPPTGRRLQTPPSAGGQGVKVFLMQGPGAGQQQEVTSSSDLAQCGFSNPAGAIMGVNGLEITMTFGLLIQKDRNPTCTVAGVNVPALSLTSGRTAGIFIVQGASATLADLHTTKTTAKASRVLSDGAPSSGIGIGIAPFFFAILVVVALGVGYKVVQSKQGGKGAPPPPTMEMNYAPQQQQQKPPPPPQMGGGMQPGSPWVEQRDQASGQPYFYNTQTGQSSWVRPF